MGGNERPVAAAGFASRVAVPFVGDHSDGSRTVTSSHPDANSPRATGRIPLFPNPPVHKLPNRDIMEECGRPVAAAAESISASRATSHVRGIFRVAGMSTGTKHTWKADAILDSLASGEIVAVDSPEAARPAWFGGRPPETESAGKASPPPVPSRAASAVRRRRVLVVEPVENQPRTWREEIRFWFGRLAACGYGASLFLHLILLVVLLSMVVVGGSPDSGGSPIIVGEAENDAVAFDEVLDTRIAANELDAREEFVPLEFDAVRPDPDQALAKEIDDTVSQLFDKAIPEAPAGGAFGVPGNNRTTRGSFTVWTEPEDPEPGQPYYIYIQMVVPKRISRIAVNDLSGTIHGTDGYNAVVPTGHAYYDDRRIGSAPGARVEKFTGSSSPQPFALIRNPLERLSIHEQMAMLRVQIPGASSRGPLAIRDKITIRSKALKEEQTLEIEF